MSQTTELTVRALRGEDERVWRDLWRDYLSFYETAVPDDVMASTFARLLGDDPRDFNAMVATSGGRVVGLVHYLFHRHAWKIEEVCYLQDLYAHPDVRGKGVGRALIEAVYKAADDQGAPTVYWLTQSFNDTARQLYDRIGVVTPFLKYQRP